MHNHWFRSKEHHPHAWTISDFMPGVRKEEEAEFKPVTQTIEQQMKMLGMMLSAGAKKAKRRAAKNG